MDETFYSADISESVLEEIGFTKNESKIYIALLEIGSTTAGKVSEKTKIHRTNVYDALNGLVKKGVVSFITKEKIKYFKAVDPKNLNRYIEEKKEMLERVLPKFKLNYELARGINESEISQGLRSFVDILNNFLDYNEPILVYGIPRIAPEMARHYLTHFHEARIAKKIPMKHIYNFDAKERVAELKKMPLTDARSLPVKFDSMVSTNICGDEIVFVLWTNPPHIARIKNRTMAESYKNYFELLWKNAK